MKVAAQYLVQLSNATQLWRACLIACTLVICWLAFSEQPPEMAQAMWDKGNHILAFSVLNILAWLSAPKHHPAWRLSGLLFFGLFIEGVQSFIPYRSAAGLDVIADMFGLALGEILRTITQTVANKLNLAIANDQPLKH